MAWSVDVLVESVGVVQDQGSQCLFPAVDAGPLDEPVSFPAGSGAEAVGVQSGAFEGPFVFDVADRQPQQLHRGLVVGEVAAVLGDLA